MKQHKWAKEIHAWADGAEIESFNPAFESLGWSINTRPMWNNDNFEFRIKPQPKAPQYLYVYQTVNGFELGYPSRVYPQGGAKFTYIGSIELKVNND